MPSRVYQLAGEQCHCIVAVPESGEQRLPVTQIGDQGCVVATDAEFKANEYIDIKLDFADVGVEAMFAHVVTSGDGQLHLRWLHFDPGEADRLATTLATFESKHSLTATEVEAADAHPKKKNSQRAKKQTRRVVKPRASAASVDVDAAPPAEPKPKTRRVTRPAAKDVEPLFPDDEPPAEADPSVGRRSTTTITPFGGSETQAPQKKKGATRRVSRPTASPAQGGDDDDGLMPTDAESGKRAAIDGVDKVPKPGEESGGRQVVIEQTANFKKLPEHSGEQKALPATGKHTHTVRRNIRGGDGKLDVGASIRSRAKTVRASELAARHDKVRVLNMSTIKELIQDAVAEAIDRLGGTLDENEKKRLLEEAEEEFQERLKAFNAEKKGWAAQRKNLEGQLERAQRLLDEEREKEIQADQFTVSAAGMQDLEKRFERLVNAAIKANGVNNVLADELRNMVTVVLDEEREKIAEHARQAQSEAIAILEKKVSRLAGSLEDSERERDKAKRRAAALEAAGGGISGQAIFSDFDDEEDKKRKMELLKVVFEQNKEMRSQLKDKGVVIKPRKKVKIEPPPEEAAEAPETSADEPAPVDAKPEPALAEAGDVDDGSYDNMVDPDDMPWTPGTKIESTDVRGDNEDDDDTGGVKKIASYKEIEPPAFTVNKSADAASEASEGAGDETSGEPAAGDDAVPESYDDLVDPDDMPWQPGQKIESTDVRGDNEDDSEDEDEDDGGVKKIANYKELEPPPITVRKADN